MRAQGSLERSRFVHIALAGAMLFASLVSLFVMPRGVLAAGSGSVSLTALGSPVVQDFDTLATTGSTNTQLPIGWYLSEAGTSAANNDAYAAGTGSNNAGDVYAFGAAGVAERSFGTLRSGTLIGTIGGSFTNTTGATISTLTISYTGEQWRAGVTNRNAADRLDFQLSTDATSLTTGTWSDVDALDFSSPNGATTAGALDGNAAANRTALQATISGLSIPNGAVFWIRWTDFDISSSDDGLGIDSFSLTPAASGPVINEVLASTVGTDVEYIELYGEPGASLAGLSLIYVESNNVGAGTIDFRYDFATGDTLGLNGFYLIGTTAGLQSFYGVTPNVDIPTNSLENSSATVALVQTASLGGSSVGGGEVVLDAVGITDGTASTFYFGAPVVGPDGTFFPAGVRRVSDGVDTDAAADWVISDFNLGASNTPTAGTAADVAPTVASTSPANNASNVPVSGDVSVTFSESVDVAAGAISVQCPAGTTVATNSAANDVTIVTIDPASDLPANTACAIQISATGVTDNDGTPDTLAGTTSFSFTTGTAGGITRIHAVQGSGGTATAGTFTVEAIVVGDYQTQGSGQLRGFFIQEEDADADGDAATSEGIFVFCSNCPTPVSVGDKVRVTGSTSEFFEMSQISATTASSVLVIGSNNPLPTPASIDLPVPGVPSGDLAAATAAINAYFEAFEGMLVTFPDTLSVSEYFELARYGQVILTEGGRPRTFTDANTPSAAGLIDHEIALATRTVILDDTDNRENRPVDTPNTAYYHPVPGLSTSNYLRGGDTIANLTGVLHWSFAGGGSPNAWRIRPVTEQFSYAFTSANPRPGNPEVDGRLTVASFNVLNYFLSIDTSNTCAPTQNQDCRGADSAQELQRQRTKLLAALSGLDADVLGLIELENTPGKEPLADIVAGLPGYHYVDTGVIGGDAIRVGLIFKSSVVRPVGAFKVLDSSVDPDFDTSRNRPALAQTFEEIATGARFTVVVNHLKSKGSGCGAGDDDTATGQGNCNGTRTRAAQALARWLATDPTGSGDPDVLIIGDLNSYAKEDPIVALQNAGYTDLVAQFGGPGAYSYVFDGQLGYLDHALANASLVPQVVDVDEWHINADEIPLFDYNDDERTADEAAFEEESDTLPLYEPNAFRTSDHDPVIVGLNLTVANRAPAATGDSYTTAEDTPLLVAVPGVLANDADADGDSLTAVLVSGPASGELTLNPDGSFSYTPAANFSGADSFTYQASDGAELSEPATVMLSVTAVNDAPTISFVGGVSCPAGNIAQGTVRVAISDVDTRIESLTLALAPGAPAWASIVGADPVSGDVTLALTAEQNSVRSILTGIVVSDGQLSAETPVGLHVGTQTDNQINALTAAGGLFAGVPNVILGLGGQDRLTGGSQADLICGGEGDNRIEGGAGDDALFGGGTQDRISGGDGADRIEGRGGDDVLFGDDGSDSIDGGANNDRMEGGEGDDRLTGGSGTDRFDGGNGVDRAVDARTGAPERDTLVSIELIGP
jgi:uncharacterized protein